VEIQFTNGNHPPAVVTDINGVPVALEVDRQQEIVRILLGGVEKLSLDPFASDVMGTALTHAAGAAGGWIDPPLEAQDDG
jgi:hypothetical protein